MFSLTDEISKISDLRRNLRNWYVVPLFKYGIIKKATLTTKRGDSMEINSMQDYYTFFSGRVWGMQKLGRVNDRIKITDNMVILDGKTKFAYHKETELGASLLMLGEVYKEEYGCLDVQDKIVIDIGANIGDSTIYFATKGAKKVIAFEPFPATYRQAKENIGLNGLDKRIELLNMGVGGKSETIFLPDTFIGTSSMDSIGKSALSGDTHEGVPIRIITLDEIIKMYPNDETVLKMDCEGCEYASLLDATDETLKHFSEIILEYHEKSGKLMERFRKAGFTTELKAGRIMLAKRN
jgi:FkbM family methyltransferase